MDEMVEMVFQVPQAFPELRVVKVRRVKLDYQDREDFQGYKDLWGLWDPWGHEGQWEKEVFLVFLEQLDPREQKLLDLQEFQGNPVSQEMKETLDQRDPRDQEEVLAYQDPQDLQDQQEFQVLGIQKGAGKLVRQHVQPDHRDCPVYQG